MNRAGQPPADTSLGDCSPERGVPLLEVDDLNVRFAAPHGIAHAVRGVSLRVRAGEVLGVVGESGCGKSVTMLAALGLLGPSATVTGSVCFRGRELLGLPAAELRSLRGQSMAMVFQDPAAALNPVLTVGHQMAEAIRVHHPAVGRSEGRRRAIEALGQVGVPQPRLAVDRFPHEISGGMAQRVMIAMAIVNRPDLLIADEPTTALDVTVQAQILELLASIQIEHSMGVVLISHDLGVVAGLADRVAVMYAGRVVEHGPVDDIFTASRHPYTRALRASVPSLDDDTDLRGDTGLRQAHLEGSPPSLLGLPPGCAFRSRCSEAVSDCGVVDPALRPVGPVQSACLVAEGLPPLGTQ